MPAYKNESWIIYFPICDLSSSLSCHFVSLWVALKHLHGRSIWEDSVDLYLVNSRSLWQQAKHSSHFLTVLLQQPQQLQKLQQPGNLFIENQTEMPSILGMSEANKCAILSWISARHQFCLYDWERWQSLLHLETKQMESQSHSQIQARFARIRITQMPSCFHWSALSCKPSSSGRTVIETREFKSIDTFLKLIFRSQCFAASTQKKIPVPWSSNFFRYLGFKMGWILWTQKWAKDRELVCRLQSLNLRLNTE